MTGSDPEERLACIRVAKIASAMMETDVAIKQQEVARGALQLAQMYAAHAERETDERHRLFLEEAARNITRTYTRARPRPLRTRA